MKRKAGPVFAAAAFIIIVAIAGIAWNIINRYIPSKEMVELSEYFDVTGENDAAVILQDHFEQAHGLLQDDVVYIAYETVRDRLNNHFYYDEAQNQVIFTTPTDIIKIPVDGLEYTALSGSVSVPYRIAKSLGGVLYIALDFVQRYTNLEYTVIENPLRIVVYNVWGTRTYADAKKEEAIRLEGGIKSPILRLAAEGEKVTVLEQEKDWSRVMTSDGFIGYMRNKRLGEAYEEDVLRSFEEQEYTSIHRNSALSLVWHQVTLQEENDALDAAMQNVTGVNTLSPTWFTISTNGGDIASLADADYVEKAHNMGMEVWGLLDNFSPDISTREILSETASRENLELQLMEQAEAYGLDGINIDIEALKEEASEDYIQFMRELSVRCRNAKIVLSVDVPPPYEFNAYYNRAALGEVADYVIVMGYDEHYVGSKPGSVASIGYERDGITGTLKDVPREKVVSGIPFYTRLWKTDGSGEVSSEAIGMDRADAILTENNATSNWSTDDGQDYAEFTDSDGNFCQIWLENEASVREKMKLVREYKLAGVAAWKLGLERPSIWKILSE